MIKTPLCDMLGIKYPIIQAAMGPFYTTKLCSAVVNAGAFGIISHTNLLGVDPVQSMEESIHYVMEHCKGNFGVNIRVARLQIDAPALQELIVRLRKEDPDIRERLKMVVTSAGNPKPPALFFKEHDPDLLVFHVAPTLYHALKVDGLCDGIICTGYEGGGHQSYERVNTTVLVTEAVRHCKKPIVACGGFSDGRGIAAALAMGAIGVQMGTRFITTKECEFHPKYKEFILRSKDSDTMVCQGAFGPIRLLKNKYAEEHGEILPREAKKALEQQLDLDAIREDTKKYSLAYEGDIENGPVLCGQSCGNIDDIPTVKELIERMMKEAEEAIKKLNTYLT
ncbi:MAG: NAD(P)H-dependent flavin oxidoreductase [Candidatus Freyrarchaeum guaymaensis]